METNAGLLRDRRMVYALDHNPNRLIEECFQSITGAKGKQSCEVIGYIDENLFSIHYSGIDHDYTNVMEQVSK